MKFFCTLTWNFNTASNSERISEFEAWKKWANTKGTVTDWVIEYQPSNGHAHAHCVYDTTYQSSPTLKYAYKRKGFHNHPVPVRKGTELHLQGYIHKPATKEPHEKVDNVAPRFDPVESDDDRTESWSPSTEWKQELAASLIQSIKPIPLSLAGDMFDFF